MQHERQYDREQWPDLKNRLLKRWSNLSDAKLDATGGDWERVRELIKSEHGLTDAEARREIEALATGDAAYTAAPTSTRSAAERKPRSAQAEDEVVRRRMGGPVHRTN